MIEHIVLKEQRDEKTKIVSVKNPLWLGRDALEHPRKYSGFMGVSQGNHYFSKDRIESYFRFALEHFDHFLLLVDD